MKNMAEKDSKPAAKAVCPPTFDAKGHAIDITPNHTFIEVYKDWALFDLLHCGITYVHALVPDKNNPGKFFRNFVQFDYSFDDENGKNHKVDARKIAREYIDKNGSPEKAAFPIEVS